MNKNIVVIIGAGGIGMAAARALGAGKLIILADNNPTVLEQATVELNNEGYTAIMFKLDISNQQDIEHLTGHITRIGKVQHLILAAGLSPNMAPAAEIIRVDLIGTARVIEQFQPLMEKSGCAVVISSMAGHMAPFFTPEQENIICKTNVDELGNLDFIQSINDAGFAYGASKRANILAVQSAATKWGERQARLISISPGIIMTPLARLELSSPSAEGYYKMIEKSAAKRTGNVNEIASLIAFLVSEQASFITGTDILIDGGVISAIKSGELSIF